MNILSYKELIVTGGVLLTKLFKVGMGCSCTRGSTGARGIGVVIGLLL